VESFDVRSTIERFLATARQPAVIEPGRDPIELGSSNFALTGTPVRPLLECWNMAGNLTRRIVAVHAVRRGSLDLRTEHFGGRKGSLILVDLAHPASTAATRRGWRLQFREHFRLALRRQYPDWKIVELSTDPDLEHSLSPAYPRALLRNGSAGMAAIAAAEDSQDVDGALSFGLIWLDYLRRREPKLSVGGLLAFVPIGTEINTCHRVRYLDPAKVKVAVFVHGAGGVEEAVHPEDYTNFATKVEAPRTLPSLSQPEADLERLIRANVQKLDGTLLTEPVYSQAPNMASANRGILDLLAIDFQGRLTVIEIKASEDVHLPLQALDYWMRVGWHLERGDFDRAGYFPDLMVRHEAPRILLVAPATQFHPSNDTVLGFVSQHVRVEKIGLGLEWRRELKVASRECR
jgi:hypothetical protein